jgi:diguanylate cyclase (GGDEF)-like protein/PAS domain S-box-containing protein
VSDVQPRESELLFRTLLERAADIVIVAGPDRRITYISPSVERLLGYPADRFIDGLWDVIHPDDLAMAQEMSAYCRDHPGEYIDGEGRHRHADGTWRHLAVTAVNLLHEPLINGVVTTLRDVTDRHEAEEAVRRNEERFRALIAHLSDAIAVLDADGRFAFVGESVTPVLGYAPDELVGTMARDLIHPDDLAPSATRRQLIARPGEPIVGEVRARHQDGSWRWIETTATNHLATPSVAGIVYNFRDVTQRHDARDALAASEVRFRTVVEHASDVVQFMDSDGRIQWTSPAVKDVLGYEPEELVGRLGAEICHPEDYDRVVQQFVELIAHPGRHSLRTESRSRHKNGSWVWVDSIITNHLGDAEVHGIVTNFRDITARVETEHALRESEARYRSVAGASPIGIYEMDERPVLRFVNERWQEITGYDGAEALGHNWQRLLHPDDRTLMRDQWAETGHVGKPFRGMVRVCRPDGQVRWVMAATEPLFDSNGDLTGHVGTLDDITERLAAQRDTERLSDIVEASSDLVVISGRANQLLYMNGAARRFFGLDATAPIHDFDFTPFTPRWSQDKYLAETRPAIRDHGIWSGDLAYIRDGREVPVSALFLAHHDSDGRIEFVSSVTRDMSERRAFEERLEYQATHDPLTGLPNRTLFLDRLELALARSRRSNRRVAVLFCDLDHFKVVNDSLGHSAGDRLLIALAERLRDALRPGDTVARFGGDEFVILCDDLATDHDAVAIAERVHAEVHEPLTIEATEVFAAVSIGIAFSQPGTGPETMIRDADAAMYLAKERGRARYEVYDERMRASLVERLDIETALRRALARHELRVVYQPTIHLASGAIVGVEALLRWEHPERGMLVPSEFIDVAEETGLIVPIGKWVVEQACRQAQRWQAARRDDEQLFVSVNLSSRQLESSTLIDDIASVLEQTGVHPHLLGLEITESVVMRDPEQSSTALHALKDLGVRLAVDDFGTGYSSLAYLRRFPVDLLKVDRAFVDGLGPNPEDAEDRAIVAAVVSLAHTLGLQAIAEGVETQDQLAELRAMGCDMAQGFLVAKPLVAPALDDLLARDQRW